MITSGELLSRNARKFPEKEAMVYGDKRLSYGELNEEVNRLANSMSAQGLEKGDKVGMMMFNTDLFLITFFAAMKIGAVVVPLNFRLTPPEAEYILDNSDSRGFFFGAEFSPVAGELRDRMPQVKAWVQTDGEDTGDFLFAPALMQSSSAEEPGVENDISDESAIIYTSGTTGRPKGAVFNHYTQLSIGTAAIAELGMNRNDRVLHAAPLFHGGELHVFMWPCTFVGGTHVLMKFFDPKGILENVQKERITQLFGPPAMYLLMMQVPDFDQYDLSSVRYFSYGGSPMSREQVLTAIEKFKTDQFFCLLGITEGGPGGACLHPEDQVRKAGAGGVAVVNCEQRVVDEEGRDVAVGEVGEWFLRCESNMLYYYNNPEATAETLTPDGWIHTGDMATIDEDGYVTIVDRKKDMVISGGVNIYPREIELVLLEHPQVADVAVIGVPHDIYGETVMAIIVPAPDQRPEAEELREFCRGQLADFKIPRKWEFVDMLPRNPMGKVLKTSLRERYC